MLDKDFKLITETGCGNRNYSATCPIKIKLCKSSKGQVQGLIYISKYLKQFVGRNVNFYYNQKKESFCYCLSGRWRGKMPCYDTWIWSYN